MKNVQHLNGTWESAAIEAGRGNWALPGSLLPAGAEMMETHVPGEPPRGDSREWWYRRTFDVDEEFKRGKTCLEFEGLNGPATVYLNGEELGRVEARLVRRLGITADSSTALRSGRNDRIESLA